MPNTDPQDNAPDDDHEETGTDVDDEEVDDEDSGDDEADDFDEDNFDDEEEDRQAVSTPAQQQTEVTAGSRYYIEPAIAARFEKTEGQLEAFFAEISLLSKKKPDGPLNKFKIQLLNQTLENSNRILGNSWLPFPDFTVFDADALPTASDVVMMLAQYLRAMDKFRTDHTSMEHGTFYWIIKGKENTVKTSRPKRFEL